MEYDHEQLAVSMSTSVEKLGRQRAERQGVHQAPACTSLQPSKRPTSRIMQPLVSAWGFTATRPRRKFVPAIDRCCRPVESQRLCLSDSDRDQQIARGRATCISGRDRATGVLLEPHALQSMAHDDKARRERSLPNSGDRLRTRNGVERLGMGLYCGESTMTSAR